ncbi:MAG: ABC transporter substrate-binding protein [Nodularia sp. CChRGM 3473]
MRRSVYYGTILFLLGSLATFLISACNGTVSSIPSHTHKPSLTNCRVIRHTIGDVCIPANPQRIVTLSIPALANAVLLGFQPVGSTNHNQKDYIFPKHLGEQVQSVESLGGNATLSIEKMLFLKPDLIFGLDRNNRANYSLLSQIAPTLLFAWDGTPTWRHYFDFMAKALGKEDVAQKAWDQYYQRVKSFKEVLGDGYKDQKISFIYFCCGGFGTQTKNSFAGSILDDIGLQRPDSQNSITTFGEARFSEEKIEDVDGDFLFVAAYFDSDKSQLNRLQQSPLWQKLRAVQQNRVYVVDADVWRGGNLIAANLVLDDLYKYLINIP